MMGKKRLLTRGQDSHSTSNDIIKDNFPTTAWLTESAFVLIFVGGTGELATRTQVRARALFRNTGMHLPKTTQALKTCEFWKTDINNFPRKLKKMSTYVSHAHLQL